LEERFTLLPESHRTSGPARYLRVAETSGRLGLITPLTHNFCDGCNRMRVTAQGRLYMCLGHEDRVDLQQALRQGGPAALDAAIDEALLLKAARHHFSIAGRGAAPAVSRHMNVTGG
jgi:cyclic pyranopterin phosphate synthase